MRWLRMAGWILLTLVGLILLIAGIALRSEISQISPVMSEAKSIDEDRYIAEIVQYAVRMVNSTYTATKDGVYRRDVHSKSHGCVKAEFTVKDGLPPNLQHGIFAMPKTYQAWIRYSNGTPVPQKDEVKDARGMAIKLMNVPGPKLLSTDGTSQDFIMINSPVFFIGTASQYADFTKGLSAGDNYGYFLGNWSADPRDWKLRQMWLALRSFTPMPDSLLTQTYYSLSAYRLGPGQYIKFSTKPCVTMPAAAVSKGDPNYLRKSLADQLTKSEGCFDFRVQLQMDGKDMPIEDTTVKWDEDDSPFIPVAQLKIPKQTFDTPGQNQFCEDLSFNPWHALPAHEPVGVMNRFRKAVYQEVGRYRLSQNGKKLDQEPTSWDAKF